MENTQFDLKNFFDIIYSTPEPYPPNTFKIDITLNDDTASMYDVLNECFVYGILTKYGDRQRNFTITEFNFIRGYIRSIGYNVELLDYDLEDDNETVKKFSIKFSVLDQTDNPQFLE